MERTFLSPELGPLSRAVVDSAFKVHKDLGPGLLESVYESCLCFELKRREIPFKTQHPVPIIYDGHRLATDLKIDLLIDERIVVELKAAESMHPVYTAQLITYLKLTGLRLGLLINFNVPLIRDGIRRVVL